MSSNLWSQEISVGSESTLFFYKGFDQKIEINQTNKKKLKISCTGCDTMYLIDKNKNQYLVKAIDEDHLKIIFKDKKDNVLESKIFPCYSIPTPEVFLDGNNLDQYYITNIPKKIELKKTEQTIASASFAVLRWKLIFASDSKTYNGIGSMITEDVQFEMRIRTKDRCKLQIHFRMPGGTKKNIISSFEFELD